MALADPTRRGILERLSRSPMSVTEIAALLPVSRPAVSQHLKVLHDTGLVDVRPIGTRRIYQARPEGLLAMRAELDGFWRASLDNLKRAAEAAQPHRGDA